MPEPGRRGCGEGGCGVVVVPGACVAVLGVVHGVRTFGVMWGVVGFAGCGLTWVLWDQCGGKGD